MQQQQKFQLQQHGYVDLSLQIEKALAGKGDDDAIRQAKFFAEHIQLNTERPKSHVTPPGAISYKRLRQTEGDDVDVTDGSKSADAAAQAHPDCTASEDIWTDIVIKYQHDYLLMFFENNSCEPISLTALCGTMLENYKFIFSKKQQRRLTDFIININRTESGQPCVILFVRLRLWELNGDSYSGGSEKKPGSTPLLQSQTSPWRTDNYELVNIMNNMIAIRGLKSDYNQEKVHVSSGLGVNALAMATAPITLPDEINELIPWAQQRNSLHIQLHFLYSVFPWDVKITYRPEQTRRKAHINSAQFTIEGLVELDIIKLFMQFGNYMMLNEATYTVDFVSDYRNLVSYDINTGSVEGLVLVPQKRLTLTMTVRFAAASD